MTLTRILPCLMMVISVFAAFVYAVDGDWRHAVYWGAAAVLTASVTL